MNRLTLEVFELRKAGWSYPKIARHFGVSTPAVSQYFKRHAPAYSGQQGIAPTTGECQICYKTKPLLADHDHVSGIDRGLLCSNCNRLLGHAQDDPVVLREAAAYLERHFASTVVEREPVSASDNGSSR